MPMLQIGAVAFQVSGPHYDKLKGSFNASWARQKRVGRADALQYTGIGEDDVTVSGTIYTAYFAGFDALGRLRAMSNRPQTVVSGAGDVFGRWCITRLDNEQTFQDHTGAPRKVTFDVKLERYGEDGASAGLGAALAGLTGGLGLAGVGGLSAAMAAGRVGGIDVLGRLSEAYGLAGVPSELGRAASGVASAGIDVGAAAAVAAGIRLF